MSSYSLKNTNRKIMENEKTTKPQRLKMKPTIKRLLANKCERERVRKINEAFEILKTHIPYCDSNRIRTKLDVLKFAIDYIEVLTKMVSKNEAEFLLKSSQLAKSGVPTHRQSTEHTNKRYSSRTQSDFLVSDELLATQVRLINQYIFQTGICDKSSQNNFKYF